MHTFKQRPAVYLWLALFGSLPALFCAAEDRVFSGPQIGEKATPFKVLGVTGASGGKELDLLAGKEQKATAIVFVHAIERSIVPLLTVIDQYGHETREKVSTEFVFLSDDRTASEKRLPLVARSLRMQCPMSISLDGPEGPGNYGLNKACLMTIVVTRDRNVTANFALVQPGIADAPAVIRAIATACGDVDPPTPEMLRQHRTKAAPDDPRRSDAPARPGQDRAGQPQPNAEAMPAIPGAAPTDPKLLAMLRSFIRTANDDATVDGIVKEVEEYVKDDAELKKQAIGGWTRVLHLKYGTDHARAAGQRLVDRLKK
jgi:hypothetical protein